MYSRVTVSVSGRVAVLTHQMEIGLRGLARVVGREERHLLDTLQSGEILVTEMTDASQQSSLPLAAAVVTDRGGLISHASITCSELGIPCVVGTLRATSVFKTGDLLELRSDGTVSVIVNA